MESAGVQAHGELQPKPPAGPSMELGAPSKWGTGKPIKCHQELNAKSRAQNQGNSPAAFVTVGERSQWFPTCVSRLFKAARSFLQILSPSPNLLKHKIELSIFRTLIGFIQ